MIRSLLAFLVALSFLAYPRSVNAGAVYLGTVRGWSIGDETSQWPLAASGPQYVMPAPADATAIELRNVTMRWVEPWLAENLNPNLGVDLGIYYTKHDHLWWHHPAPYTNSSDACVNFTNAPIQDVPDLAPYDGTADGEGPSGVHNVNDWSNLNLPGPFGTWGSVAEWSTVDGTGLHPLWYAPSTVTFFDPPFPSGHWLYRRKVRSMMRAEVWAITPP